MYLKLANLSLVFAITEASSLSRGVEIVSQKDFPTCPIGFDCKELQQVTSMMRATTDRFLDIECGEEYFAPTGCPIGYCCNDIDECADGTDNCEDGFTCSNTIGDYDCDDIDECADGTDSCEDGFTCSNTIGDYDCDDILSDEPSSAPPCQPNFLPTNACSNDPHFTFLKILDPTTVLNCSWITKNNVEERRGRYCNSEEIANACPQACEICCADDPNYEFRLINFEPAQMRKCEWLTKNNADDRVPRYCGENRMVKFGCCESCASFS